MAETTTLGNSLNTDMSAMPFMGSTKEAQDYSSKALPLMKEQIAGEAGLEKEKLLQKASEFGAKSKSEREYQQQATGLYKEAENKELEYPRPEFHPTKENAQSLGELFSLVATMGVMLGGGGKMAAQGALDSMTGMLKGWQSGRKDLYEKELKEFDKEYKRVQDIRTDIQNKLQKGMQLASIDKEASYSELQQAAALSGASSIVQSYIKAGQPKMALDLMNKAISIDKDVLDRQQKAEQHRQSMFSSHAANYQYFQNPDGTVIAINTKNPQDVQTLSKETSDLLRGANKLGGTKKEKDLKKGETVAQNMSEIIGQKIDIDTAAKIAATHDFTRKLQDLKTTNVKLGNVSGIAVNFSNQINQFLTRKVGENGYITQADMDEAKTNLDSDKSFQGLSDKSKIMAKKELDTVMSYLQTKYGNRAPVAEFRAANSVLSRKSSSATSYNAILDNEITAANQRLAPLVNPKQAKSIYDYLDKNADEITNILNPEKTSDLENLLKQNNLPYEPNKFDYMILDGVVHSKPKAKVQ